MVPWPGTGREVKRLLRMRCSKVLFIFRVTGEVRFSSRIRHSTPLKLLVRYHERWPPLERNSMHRAGIGFALVWATVMASPCKAQGTPIVYQTPSGTGSLQKLVGQLGASD